MSVPVLGNKRVTNKIKKTIVETYITATSQNITCSYGVSNAMTQWQIRAGQKFSAYFLYCSFCF